LTESDLQKAIIMWADTMEDKWPELRWLHHIPNGGKRDGREALSLKRQGVKSGVCDLFLPVRRANYGGLYIELKRPGTNAEKELSDKQIEFLRFAQVQMFATMASSDFEDVKRCIVEYLESST